ncbi:hypothetical protein MOJ79_16925 [Calidifontimicrobium sp. SYSU G02091]|uniref:hypothetical protein n=1 Tax=Calidifontimicrobium sp. SYSU G02091 TaxID=2926421 RepID=UPI001F53962E|nr:hypothetical protein [Calidifontimicrobium sp. SYSU G02091]MCI1193517.1 hypothetical protein [Calidifontimicrobium sp. SYSU G02091]
MDGHDVMARRIDAAIRFEDSHGPCAEYERNADAVGTACDRAGICQSRSPACQGSCWEEAIHGGLSAADSNAAIEGTHAPAYGLRDVLRDLITAIALVALAAITGFVAGYLTSV